MESFADLVVRRGRLLLGLSAIAVVAALLGLRGLRRESDILAFLPTGDPQVALFREVGDRFGGLDVALVGIETGDVLAPEALDGIRLASTRIRSVRDVEGVLSLTEMTSARSSDQQLDVGPLVPRRVPRDRAALGELRARILHDRNAVGTVVSADGRAALIIAFLAPAANSREVTRGIRAAARAALPGARLAFGGAPFVGDTVAAQTEADLRRLTPFAALAILLVLFGQFRDAFGIALALGTIFAGAIVALGAMGALGQPFTIVSGSLPVLLFSCGIGYALHVLSAFNSARERLDPPEAVREALREVGWPVLVSGLTTVAAFLSFLAMDVQPMRMFGLFAAIGSLSALGFALVALPAALAMGRRRGPRQSAAKTVRRLTRAIATLGARRRGTVIAVAAALSALSIAGLFRVQNDVAVSNFFRPGSEPYQAEAFLARRFGGSQFVQIDVRGDMTDPAVLAEVARIHRAAAKVEGVSDVRSIAEALETASEAMGQGRRLPATRGQSENLYFLLEGETALAQLVDARRSEALVQVRISGMDAARIARTLDHLEAIAAVAPAAAARVAVTGMPAVNRAFARSNVRNQMLSTGASLTLVILLAACLFRSPVVGILAALPSVVTLLLVLGGMGWLGIALDTGTSMIGSIGLGAGIDQAIHFLWHMRAAGPGSREATAARAGEVAGPAITAGALMVTAGFAILALGETLPMHYFGLLTAEAMLLGSLATLLVMPAVIGRMPAARPMKAVERGLVAAAEEPS
ncbi:MAG: MMPL family transporter [Myxococcota bacterium]|mgnify:CR=1 FL=1